jgi:two-component system NtrC family sensor kinase
VSTASLLVVQGIETGSRFELNEAPIHLGRGLQNDVRIADTEVSRMHASIQSTSEGYVLTDRNSSNGTFINGQQVRSKTLVNGDQILIGRTLLLFADSANPAETREAADHVRLLNQHDPADRSSIISQLPQDADRVAVRALAPQSAHLLQTLYRISEEAVQPTASVDQLLQRILDLTIAAVGADRGCVLVIDAQTTEIQPVAVSGNVSAETTGRMPVSRSIVDSVLKSKQGVQTSDAQHDSRFDTAKSIVRAGIREAMCVPLPGRQGLLGVIYVDITTPAEQAALVAGAARFRDDQLRLLAAIGRQAALALENFRFQQAFVRAERLAAMGQTIATLSHHIKNILQGVRGGSYLIDMGLQDHNEELVRKGWGIVEKNQDKIYHLVMDMLTFSKERQPALKRAQLNETVSEVVDLMQSRAEECRVELRYHPDGLVPLSTFDPEGIQRAVLNIVTNAIDAVEGSDRAVVTVLTGWDRDTETLWVSVADNGPGIAPENLTRIFNIFESTKGARGTGLGLAVSQKILREHGGEIVVESQLGEGSRFTLSWPRHDDDPSLNSRTIS